MQKVLCPKVLVRKKKLPYEVISEMGGFFCAPSPQAIDFWHLATCSTANNFVFNFDQMAEKINFIILVDKSVSKQKVYSSKINIF